MKFSGQHESIPVDEWVWGQESLLWGYDSSHAYTLKILAPKVGRAGCLSLQYHHEKSETWFVLSGEIWALMIQSGEVITRIMKKGDFQNLPAGTVHRMMALSDDAKVLESSTPDRHAADKSVPKDVVRLHCVHGRECESFDDAGQQAVVERSIQVTEEAIATFERGGRPAEIGLGVLEGAGVVSF